MPMTSTRPFDIVLHKTAWVNLNSLRTGVERFHLSMHKWGLASLPNCEGCATEQTTHRVLTVCLIYWAQLEAQV